MQQTKRAPHMSDRDREAVSEIIRKYTVARQREFDEFEESDGSRHANLKRPSFTTLWETVGISKGTGSNIVHGRISFSPVLAMRLLRALRPVGKDLETFLQATHLKEILAEAATTLSEAGYQSKLTQLTGLLWAAEIADSAATREALELKALSGMREAINRGQDVADFERCLREWKEALRRQDIRTMSVRHLKFHELLAKAKSLSDGEREELRLIRVTSGWLHQTALGDPKKPTDPNIYGRNLDPELEWSSFDVHEKIYKSLKRDDLEMARYFLMVHFSWSLYPMGAWAPLGATRHPASRRSDRR